MTTVFTWVITVDTDEILYVVIDRYVFLVSRPSHKSSDGFYADWLDTEEDARAEALRLMQEDEEGGFTLSGPVFAYRTPVDAHEVYEMSGPKATTWLRRLMADATCYGKVLV